MKRISTLIVAIALYTLSFAQWNAFNSGLFGNKDQTMKDGTYFKINYPNGVQATTDFTNWNAVNNGLPLDGNNIFAESLGNNDTYLFCGTHSGVYRSDDDGANWAISNGSIPFSNMEFVKKFYEFNGDMYAMMNTDVGTGGGLFISTNNGNTWFGTAGGMGSNATIYSVMEHNGILYANTDVTLYVSTDWGANWIAHTHFNYGVFAFWATDNVMVASTTIGMERSTDGGTNWSTITGPTGLTSGEAIGVPGAIYIGARGGSSIIWKGTDDGLDWIFDISGISAIDQSTFYQFYQTPGQLFLGAITNSYSKAIPIVSVEELHLSSAFSSYYNENSDAIAVRYNGQRGAKVEAILYDLTGRKLEVMVLKDELSKFQRTGLNTGIYIVQFNMDGGNMAAPIKVIVP